MVLCGLCYPLLMTGLGRLLFPHQANGSLIEADGRAVDSEFIGQSFTDPRFMKCRPSAVGYNTYTQAEKDSGEYAGIRSGSDSYAPLSPKLVARVASDMNAFLAANLAVRREDISTDLLTTSGSGLDPHIQPAVQLPALAEATGLPQETLSGFVKACTGGKFLCIFGGETVNVLKANLLIAESLQLV